MANSSTLRELVEHGPKPPFSLCHEEDEKACPCNQIWSTTDDACILIGEDATMADSLGEGYTREQAEKNMRFVIAAMRNFIPLLDRLDALEKCLNCLTISDSDLEHLREIWGNTNVAVYKHWKEQAELITTKPTE